MHTIRSAKFGVILTFVYVYTRMKWNVKVMTEYVYPEWFGMGTSEDEQSKFKRWMEPVTHVYSKGMATLAEGAVSQASTVCWCWC